MDIIEMFVQGDGGRRPLKGCHWCSPEFIVMVAMTRYHPES